MNNGPSSLTQLISFLTLGFALIACNFELTIPRISEGMPDIGIPTEDLNQKLRVLAPKGWNNFKTDDSVVLDVRAISQETIIMSPDDARAFTYVNGKWLEVPNKGTGYPYDFTYVLDPSYKDDPTYSGTVVFLPSFQDSGQSAMLRIFVFGYVSENGVKTDRIVASYIDVELKP